MSDRVPHKQVHQIALTSNSRLGHQPVCKQVKSFPVLSKVVLLCHMFEHFVVVDGEGAWGHHIYQLALWLSFVGLRKDEI